MVLDALPEMAGAIALYRAFGFVDFSPSCRSPIERTIYLERSLTD
jgi:hypothetical protein